jgi:hypothetical protein
MNPEILGGVDAQSLELHTLPVPVYLCWTIQLQSRIVFLSHARAVFLSHISLSNANTFKNALSL